MGMAISFRDLPIGDISLEKGGIQIKKQPVKEGVPAKDIPKSVFSLEPVRKFGTKGHWWEIRVDEWLAGNLCFCAIGFTATDPETLVEGEESALPPRAHMIPKTYLLGYQHSIYWDGQRHEYENLWDSKVLKPLHVPTIGVLATPAGSLQLYINRRLQYTFDPSEYGLPPISTDEPLFAVLDCVGAIKKAELMTNSLPPSEDEFDD